MVHADDEGDHDDDDLLLMMAGTCHLPLSNIYM